MKYGYWIKFFVTGFILFIEMYLLNINLVQASKKIENSSETKPQTCLTISNYREAVLLSEVPLRNDYFSLSFIHSVSLTPVVDYYQFNNGTIVQIAERFEHHGAGLPSNVNEGKEWITKNGYFWLLMERDVEPLIVRTDNAYKNRLWLNRQPPDDLASSLNTQNSDDSPLDDTGGKGYKDDEAGDDNKINLNKWPNTALLISVRACS